MKRILLIAALSVAAAFPQSFPGSIYTPLVATDNVSTTLSQAMLVSDTTAFVASTTGWAANTLAYICDSSTSTAKCTGTYEIMKVTSVGGANALNVVRGQGGTSAVAHAVGKVFSNAPVSLYNKTVNDEVLAIENALGTNLSNLPGSPSGAAVPINKGGTAGTTAAGARANLSVPGLADNNVFTGSNDFTAATHTLPARTGAAASKPATCAVGEQYFANDANAGRNMYLCTGPNAWTQANATATISTPDYNFPAQTPGGSLTAGGVGQSITLTPCPPGLAGADAAHYVYLSGGTGTAEKMLITGGTCASGAATGTITGTPANAHSGAWTVASATFGLQEAINAASAAGGGTVTIPPGTYVTHATTTVAGNGIHIFGNSSGGFTSTTIQRTEDFGNTIYVAGNDFSIAGVDMVHVINFTATPFPGSIVNKPTSGAHLWLHAVNTGRIEHVRLENMPYNIYFESGADITVDSSQFQGLWEPAAAAVQVTKAAISVNYVAGLGIPTYLKFYSNQFYGYASAAAGKHNVGPKYMIEIYGCEDLEINGGAMGGASVSNLGIFPSTTSLIVANIRVRGVKFDSARDSDVVISGDGAMTASDLIFADNIFNGESQSDFGLSVTNPGSGTNSVTALVMTGNDFLAYLASPVHLLDGIGYVITGNSARYYNTANTYADSEHSSGIYVGGRANNARISNNPLGGGQSYSNYGVAGNFGIYGLTLADPTGAQNQVWYENNRPFTHAMVNSFDNFTFASRFSVYPNRALAFTTGAVTGSVAMGFVDEPGTSNLPGEFHATSFTYIGGPILAPAINYIASETGANNAIAGALANVPLSAGLTVSVKLGHTLQAGANTFNYNAGGAVSIKSSRNAANNIATAYAATGLVKLQYDGTQWLDVSQ